MGGNRIWVVAVWGIVTACSGRDLGEYQQGTDAGTSGSGGGVSDAGSDGGGQGGSGGIQCGQGICTDTCCADLGDLTCELGGCDGTYVECWSPSDCPQAAPVCCLKNNYVSCSATAAGCEQILCTHPTHCGPGEQCVDYSILADGAFHCYLPDPN
ncbi:MAG: hypothetical protein R3B13_18105 [Polyangiaceae bacterium]